MSIQRPNNSTSRDMPINNDDICLPQGLYDKVHSSFIHDNSQMETTQIRINVYHTVIRSEILCSTEKKNKPPLHKRTWMHLSDICQKKKKKFTQECILYHFRSSQTGKLSMVIELDRIVVTFGEGIVKWEEAF